MRTVPAVLLQVVLREQLLMAKAMARATRVKAEIAIGTQPK
jgi:hypothetical protein